jgi:hypothetical protein
MKPGKLMEKLTDPNPYDILQITPDADRQAIKRALAERQRENKGQTERQQALKARNALSSVETRLLVDALTPNFVDGVSEAELIAELSQSPIDDIDWLSLLDEDRILRQDFRAYLEAIIQHTLGKIPPPVHDPQITSDFDGLEEFLATWLK